jgi:hypothetical protein
MAFKRAELRQQRISRFDRLLSSLRWYDDTFFHLPKTVRQNESGATLYSWRVTLMPFNEGVKDLLDLDSPWTAPSNRFFAERAIWLYCDPDERDNKERIKGVVSVIVADDTPMQPTLSHRLSEVPEDTVLLIEAKPQTEHWMAPGDLPVSALQAGVFKHAGQGVLVGFADGEIWQLRDSVPIEELARFATVNPSEPRNREAKLGPFKMHSTRARAFDRR